MSKSEQKSLIRIVKKMRREGETWRQVGRHLNRNGIRTVRGNRWSVPNLQAWFYKQAQAGKRQGARRAA